MSTTYKIVSSAAESLLFARVRTQANGCYGAAAYSNDGRDIADNPEQAGKTIGIIWVTGLHE